MLILRLVDNEQPKGPKRKMGPHPLNYDFTRYWDLNEINQFHDSILAAYPGITSNINIGTSFQGRPIRGIRLNTGGTGKKSIIIESLIHSREWICGGVTNWWLVELLSSTNPRVVELRNRYDWYWILG
jgi:murein tripeptide amidase MpaA